jgi:preprotein translocase subunit SecF
MSTRNIDFLSLSKTFGMASIALVVGSWFLVATGQLKLGIDFAGGTEALVSFPTEVALSDQDLKTVAKNAGLKKAEVVEYVFQDKKATTGFFVRSLTQKGLLSEKSNDVKAAVFVEAGYALTTWQDASFTLTKTSQDRLVSAFEGKIKTDSDESKLFAKAAKELKAKGVAWNKEKSHFTYAGGKASQDALASLVGQVQLKMWDASDESGERIRVQFFSRPSKSTFEKALIRGQVEGGLVSAENETRSPVFVLSVDDSIRLKTALIAMVKSKGASDKIANQATVSRFEKVGATAGKQLRNKGILAVIYALIFILLYIALRFDPRYSPGAILALFHDVSITLGIFCLMGREFNLPIIAALLAIVGYSLNDTIVVYDRIRENQDNSKANQKLSSIINVSINDCLSRTILTSVTTFLAVLAIFFFGGGIIENFAFAMLIGVIVGTYSSIYIASPLVLMMDQWLEQREAQKTQIEKALS